MAEIGESLLQGQLQLPLKEGCRQGCPRVTTSVSHLFSVPEFPVVVEKEGSSVKMALGSSRRSGSRRSWQRCQLKLT